jgi:hypothetical protein
LDGAMGWQAWVMGRCMSFAPDLLPE